MNSLKTIREKAGLTQVELADKSGVCRATIAALENGRDNCLTKTMAALASALGTTVDKLMSA